MLFMIKIFLKMKNTESKENLKIEWQGVGNNVFIKMKINKMKSRDIKLQKSPLVLDKYDPKNDPSTCVFEGYFDEKAPKTPILVLGCPSADEIEVI